MEKSGSIKVQNFLFDFIPFQWGHHLSDVKSTLKPDSIFIENENPANRAESLKCKIPSFLSITTNSVVFEAPFLDRLIHRIRISIPPQEMTANEMMSALEKEYGQPTRDSGFRDVDIDNQVQSCIWEFVNCTISIYYFGFVQKVGDEKSKAHLYINLKDIDLLDSLYSSSIKAETSRLESHIKRWSIRKFNLGRKQEISWTEHHEKYPSKTPDFISEVLNGFHKQQLYRTPEKIRKKLKLHQVCIWKSKDGGHYISNYFETGPIHKDKTVLCGVLPPIKGSGWVQLHIGDFNLMANYGSTKFDLLSFYIEKILGIKIEIGYQHF